MAWKSRRKWWTCVINAEIIIWIIKKNGKTWSIYGRIKKFVYWIEKDL